MYVCGGIVVAATVGAAETPRNSLLGWGLLAAGGVLHRGHEDLQLVVFGIVLSCVIQAVDAAPVWWHCIGYSVLCAAAVRFSFRLVVLCIGVCFGVSTWVVVSQHAPEWMAWGPYWVVLCALAVQRIEKSVRSVLVWMIGTAMVVAGWELGTSLGLWYVTLLVTYLVVVCATPVQTITSSASRVWSPFSLRGFKPSRVWPSALRRLQWFKS